MKPRVVHFPRAVLLLLLGGWLHFSSPAVVAGQSADFTVNQFWELVTETRTAVSALVDAPPAAQTGEMSRLAVRWNAIRAVRLADGRRAPIAPTRLVALLLADLPMPSAIQTELDALLATRDDWPNRLPLPSDADERLARILAGPEYQSNSDEEPNAVDRFLRNLLLRFLLLIARLTAATPSGLAALLGGAVLLLILIFGLRGLWQTLVGEAALVSDHHLDELISAATALHRARQFSEAGDYRTAVRYLYLSTLLELEERGLLIYDRSRTNREYLRSVADRPDLAATLRDVVDVFDRVWYGYQPLAEDAYLRYQSQVEDLRRRRGAG